MRILFVMGHAGFGRNFESAIRLLAERGHSLHILLERPEGIGGEQHLQALSAAYRSITLDWFEPQRDAFWQPLGIALRSSQDYLRYLDARFANSASLIERAERQAPDALVSFTRSRVMQTAQRRRALSGVLRTIDHTLPPAPSVDRLLDSYRPDAVLLTPLLYIGSTQVDFVRSARIRGIPTVLCVTSWDHLTTKGLIHESPDRVLLWNPYQKQEAVELHGVAPERVVVTGAQAYDHWFEYGPTATYDSFCTRVGLDPARPFVFYVCSSAFIAPGEARFVRDWLARLRSDAPKPLRDVGVLVRPHPQNAEQWTRVNLASFDNVAIWPPLGANPVDAHARSDYFDSMYHASAVVGINTSAFIESAIVGQPVYTVLVPEYANSQRGTLHFQHLLHANGGLLHVGSTFEEHFAQLSRAFTCADVERAKSRRFVEAFVRPNGIDVAATPRFVDAIETLPRPSPAAPPAWYGAARVLLAPSAAAVWGLRWLGRRPEHAGSPLGWLIRRGSALMLDRLFGNRRVRAIARRYVVPRVVGSSGYGQYASSASGTLARLATTRATILLGPWVGDVDTERARWIPFLRWARHSGGLADKRLIAVSRGPVAAWYEGITDEYLDLFELFDAGRIGNKLTIDYERCAADAIRKRLDIEELEILPASLVQSREVAAHA